MTEQKKQAMDHEAYDRDVVYHSLVEKIAKMIEDDLLNSYAPNFFDEDGNYLELKDLLSNTDTVDSGIENIRSIVDGMDSIFEIAKLIQKNQ